MSTSQVKSFNKFGNNWRQDSSSLCATVTTKVSFTTMVTSVPPLPLINPVSCSYLSLCL